MSITGTGTAHVSPTGRLAAEDVQYRPFYIGRLGPLPYSVADVTDRKTFLKTHWCF